MTHEQRGEYFFPKNNEMCLRATEKCKNSSSYSSNHSSVCKQIFAGMLRSEYGHETREVQPSRFSRTRFNRKINNPTPADRTGREIRLQIKNVKQALKNFGT
ncbi:hypothetical protein AVEN_46932-1 [Araneus ventricosus]|uniref:Uncharacterized protein n=1 Tax=Araneus ventricosus TaxID=182803 RepID=A0A4Y2FJH8_ARAVE|nr:hypothetical protein AVEN_46932-1 [Araneus ventricosus]